MSPMYYILQGQQVVPEPDSLKWAQWFETATRRIAKDQIGDIFISTVFLGVDHQFGDGPPILFETMVFRGSHGCEMQRYQTWDEAEKGHKEMVAAIRAETLQKTTS